MGNKIKLAGCVISNTRGEILLLHRNITSRTQWETPGGKVEEGETPQEAAKREAFEELEIIVELGPELGRKCFTEDDAEIEYAWFQTRIVVGNPAPKELKFDDCQYFSWNKMLAMKRLLSANVRNLLLAYQNGELVLP